jgi:Ser/Thr protein kinase RdoA (MazF antagonist)
MGDLVRADRIDLSKSDLVRLARRFGIGALERLGGFENLLLRSVEPAGRVVRLSHGTRRSLPAVAAEVAFMHHLADHGVPVVAPIESIDGSLVEPFTTDRGEQLIAYCMTEAPGAIRHPAEWSDSDIIAYGDLLGRAHHAAGRFDPPLTERRPDWTDPFFDPGVRFLDDPPIVDVFHETRRRAREHPAGGTDLLIHQDAHFWNLHVSDDGHLTLFDFDDCGYGTAEHDVAIVVFYWLFIGWPDPTAELGRFLRLFLQGYERHATLTVGWTEGFDHILKVREVDIYLLIAMSGEEPRGAEAAFMVDRRRRLLDWVPYLGVPLTSLLD